MRYLNKKPELTFLPATLEHKNIRTQMIKIIPERSHSVQSSTFTPASFNGSVNWSTVLFLCNFNVRGSLQTCGSDDCRHIQRHIFKPALYHAQWRTCNARCVTSATLCQHPPTAPHTVRRWQGVRHQSCQGNSIIVHFCAETSNANQAYKLPGTN